MTSNKVIDKKQYQKLRKVIQVILEKAKMQIEDSTRGILANSYWQIGEKIEKEGLTSNANYKNLTLQNLEEDLGIAKSTLGRALQFYQIYPSGIQENLSWSHYRQLITVKDVKSRASLTKSAASSGWSVKELESKIQGLNNQGSAKGSKVGSTKGVSRKIKRPTDPSYLYMAQIIDVVDGDTLILHIDLGFEVIKKQRVRLAQIDAPEMKSAAGKKSHQYLRDLCAGIEKVAIKTNKVDIYGRFIGDIFYLEGRLKRGTTQGDIFTGGIYLNQKLVEEGVAKAI